MDGATMEGKNKGKERDEKSDNVQRRRETTIGKVAEIKKEKRREKEGINSRTEEKG